MTPHQYTISALLSEKSFREVISGGVAKYRLFSRGRLLIELDEHVELEELVLSSVSPDNGYDPFT